MKKIINMDKKGVEGLMYTIIFYLLIIIFFASMFYGVASRGSGANFVEQTYAKQIGLTIDKAKPGTNITLDISELYDSAIQNKYHGKIIDIDKTNKAIVVQVIDGKAYRYNFFNNASIVWDVKPTDRDLIIKLVK